jgi:hypothetical protein
MDRMGERNFGTSIAGVSNTLNYGIMYKVRNLIPLGYNGFHTVYS